MKVLALFVLLICIIYNPLYGVDIPPDVGVNEDLSVIIGKDVFQGGIDGIYYNGDFGTYYFYEHPTNPTYNFYFAVGRPEIKLRQSTQYTDRKIEFYFPLWFDANAQLENWVQVIAEAEITLKISVKVELSRGGAQADPEPIKFTVLGPEADLLGKVYLLTNLQQDVIKSLSNALGVKVADKKYTFSINLLGNTNTEVNLAIIKSYPDPEVNLKGRTYKVKLEDPAFDTHPGHPYEQVHVGARGSLQ